MKQKLKVLIGIFLTIIIIHNFSGSSAGQNFGVGTIQGRVVNSGNVGIPGLTLYLVHPTLGRSYPSMTNNFGNYFFSNLPVNQVYYLEIYWGNRLIYRKPCPMNGPFLKLPNIIL